jgi:ureidoglycolate hydrolase
MVDVPLSLTSEERTFAGLPAIVLTNRFFEQNPATAKGGALLARPGSDDLDVRGDGPIRANYSLTGLFGGALFFVSGGALFRRNTDGTTIPISGTVYNSAGVSMSGVAGAGYQRLFIADGSLLQFYEGGTRATGTLTVSAQIAEGEVVRIGSSWYQWTATVINGSGTEADPWRVLIGATALASVQNLLATITFTGISGTTYSGNLGGQNTEVTAALGDLTAPADGLLSVTQISEGTRLRIGATYYRWTATVGAGDGTLGDPWDVLLDATIAGSLTNMEQAVEATGTDGVTYSAGLTANALVTATAAAATLAITETGTPTDGSGIPTTVSRPAFGTLTGTGTPTADATIQVGTVYYRWVTTVSAGTGTEANPWKVLIGANLASALANMASAFNATGTAGTTYSAGLTVQNTAHIAVATTTTLIVTERGTPTDGSTTLTAVVPATGTNVSWAAASLLQPTISWDAATLVPGTGSGAIDVTARTDLAAGNDIVTVTDAANGAWGAATLTGGGTHALSGVAMPDGLPPISVATLKSHVLVAIGNSDRFYWITPGEVEIDGLNFATAESQPDDVIAVTVVGDTAWFIGNGSTEVWYATGAAASPFAPVSGRVYDRGAIEGTVVNIKGVVFLVGQDYIVYGIGGSAQRVSNHGVEQMIREALESV